LNKLSDFRNIHKDEWCYVCGSGVSIKDFKPIWGHKIIGINDITQYVKPDYLIMADTMNYTDKNADKIERILGTDCEYAFSIDTRMAFDYAKLIGYDTRHWSHHEIDKIFGQGFLFSCVSTSEAAVALALYMGFSFIGMIGIDYVGYGYDSQLKEVNECYQNAFDYGREHNQFIYNLSQDSLITAIPYIPNEYFRMKD
jgi:hypothetical protein